MKRALLILLGPVVAAVGACTSAQEITRLERPTGRVCIVKHDAVKEGVLEEIRDGFARRSIATKTVDGTYAKKHGLWQPTWNADQVSDCEALCFYVANWSWDLAAYMYFANIWMTNADGSKRLGEATYDATSNLGPGKFINARSKIGELMDGMLADITSGSPAQGQTLVLPAEPDTAGRLQQLEDLRTKGLVSDEEYRAKRQEVLDAL